jgi:hypothetical protein
MFNPVEPLPPRPPRATVSTPYFFFYGFTHRFNMKLDLQSLFGLRVPSCNHWLRPRIPPAYTRAILAAKIDDISLWPPTRVYYIGLDCTKISDEKMSMKSRWYSLHITTVMVRWASKLFLKTSNRKSANSWAHSTIANPQRCASLQNVNPKIFNVPKVSHMEAVWKSCGRVSRQSSREKQASTPQLLWACPPRLYSQKYLHTVNKKQGL